MEMQNKRDELDAIITACGDQEYFQFIVQYIRVTIHILKSHPSAINLFQLASLCYATSYCVHTHLGGYIFDRVKIVVHFLKAVMTRHFYGRTISTFDEVRSACF